MSKFEYLMMITSVVVAVGLGEVIAGWGRLLREQTTTITLDWLHISATLVILISLVDHWTGMWIYKDLEIRYLGQVMFLMLPSFFVVLAAFAISPNPDSEDKLDCRVFYFSKHKSVWLSFATFIGFSIAADYALIGFHQRMIINHLPFLLPLGMLLVLAFSSKKWIHMCFVTFLLVTSLANFSADITSLDTPWWMVE